MRTSGPMAKYYPDVEVEEGGDLSVHYYLQVEREKEKHKINHLCLGNRIGGNKSIREIGTKLKRVVLNGRERGVVGVGAGLVGLIQSSS